MSRSVSTATPHIPTSPSDRGESESYPMRVGKSKAVESPVCPCWRRVEARVRLLRGAEPGERRMVQRRLRYMVGWTPRA